MLAWLADQYGVALSGREAASFLVEAGDGDTLLIRNEMGLSDFRAGEIVSINLSGLRNALDDCPGGFDRLFNIASGEERTAREPSIRWESSPNQTHAGPGRDRTRFVSVWADRVRNAWERPSGTARGATADVAVALRSTGHVDHIEIVRSSGDRNFDQSVIAAIQAASPLPVPDSAEAFQRANLDKVTFRFNPDGS
ncbi:energy transducer TonB [Natronocella acetinitrilica]|nr:energy transducer TonB [Natronocella acetinitrilica]